MRFVRVVLLALVAAAVCSTLVVFLSWRTVPDHNSSQNRFDTLIVLGNPAKADGTPSPELRERIDESVREYKAGVAPHIIMTGGPAHNRFVEGQVMADSAVAEGVPRDAIIVEGHAKRHHPEHLVQPRHHGCARLALGRGHQFALPPAADRAHP